MQIDTDAVYKQFAHPEGRLGELAGEYMAIDNDDLNRWAISLLSIQESDAILEVSFGPGVAIEEMAKQVSKGFIAGVDLSDVMFYQARKRNAEGIEKGLIDLRLADAINLAQFNRTFDKVLAVNSIMYWEKPLACLEQINAVLKPGGLLAIALQRSEAYFQQEKCREELSLYRVWLQQAGFVNIQAQGHILMKPTAIFPTDFESGQVLKSTTLQKMIGFCLLAFKPS